MTPQPPQLVALVVALLFLLAATTEALEVKIYRSPSSYSASSPTTSSIKLNTRHNKSLKYCLEEPASLREGSVCLMKVIDVFPTQLPIGYVAAACKRDHLLNILEKDSTTDFFDHLEKNPVPVVMGYYNNNQHTRSNISLYVTDHHHLLYAITLLKSKDLPHSYADMTDRYVYVTIQRDFSRLDRNTFWSTMVRNNLTYTFDERGIPLKDFPDSLPSSILYLKNDPFRSLSYFDRRAGGYAKSDKEFVEFLWGNYLRNTNQFEELNQFTDLTDFDKEAPFIKDSIDQAVKLSQLPAARNLPGYGEGTVEKAECKYFK
ncbi:hypothetical protein FDP41_002114 [Naegleria fowleri]|uniref:Uncharacterized protein n=1 Tax=Naegleria fowleri TaxID=5763 RepID=A0A6A5BXJ1_NAEFO|nr:uncharacterized protein FDP41_002114 [Naegleria fowleri]KAF0979044.1 hypothetical protein FDP41_002114 [Naegleria fowleri]CAG4711541.1 unnamed protein product [Naegleria fowleri]